MLEEHRLHWKHINNLQRIQQQLFNLTNLINHGEQITPMDVYLILSYIHDDMALTFGIMGNYSKEHNNETD